MNTSSQPEPGRCRTCGAVLVSNRAGDVCPGCALEQAIEPQGPTHTVRIVSGEQSEAPAASAQGLPCRFGDYELLEEVARGGMGVVFKARQVSLDRFVAVKMLLFGPLARAEDVQRFRTEAAAAASLQHPNIVAIHEVGFRDRQHFLAMDYVAGPTLAELVQAGPLPPRRAAGYVKTIAEAIHYAHERGVLHRDLKPSNILLDASDQPRITDFGLAKRLEKDTELTLSGQIMGSPGYMAPEQATGHRGLVGKRSDVYSLGGILYHLVSGRAPFVAPSVAETLEQVRHAEPVSPTVLNPHLPRDLKTICLKCLEKQPARRYQTAQELAEELGRWLRGEPILARPVSRPEKVWRWCRRKPVAAALTAVTVVAILIGVAGVMWEGRQAGKARDVAQRRLYAAQMSQAFRAWDSGNFNVARDLLEAERPQPGKEDLRGADWRWLWSLCRSEGKVLRTAGEWQIFAAELSPDNRRVATAGWSHDIRIYDLEGGGEPQVLRGHTIPLFGLAPLAFSPDGRRLASASGGLLLDRGPCEFFLWDLATAKKTVLEGHALWLWAVAFSPDGNLLASACLDGTVGLWDANTCRNLAMLPGHRKSAFCVAFSPDSKLLFSGGEDGTVRCWDVATHREIGPPLQHEVPVASLAVSPDGRMVATACYDNYLRLWNPASGQLLRKLRYGPEAVVAPAFSPDGRSLAFGTGDNIRIWDLEADREKTVLRGAAGGIMNLRFSLDGKQLVSASEFERPVLWELDRPEKVTTLGGFQEGIFSMTVSADSRLLAVGSAAFFEPALPGEVRVFDLASQQLLMPPLEHPQGVSSVALAADGRLLATSCEDGHARVYALPEGRLLRTLTNAVLDKKPPMNNTRGSLVLSADGQTLVTSMSSPRQLALWNTRTWQCKPLLRDPPGGAQKFAFSADGSLLMTPLGGAKTAIIWNMPSGTTNRVLGPLDTNARGAAFSHDGRVVALNTFFDIWLFEVKTGKPLGTLKGHEHVIEALAFAPDGKTLASAGLDGVRLWSLPALAEVAALHDHQGAVEAITFTSDGQWLITGGRDKTVKLRRLPSFAEIEAAEEREPATTAERDRAVRKRRAQEQALRARDPGAIKQWLMLWPIPMEGTTDGSRALQQEQVPRERDLRPRAGEAINVGPHKLVWRAVRLKDYLIDFNQLAGAPRENQVAYAVAYVRSEAALHDVRFKVGSDDQAEVYLNGKLIYQCRRARSYIPDQDTVSGLELSAGINVVVFKVVNQTRDWRGSLWFTGVAGQPLKGIKVTLEPPR